MPDPISGPTAWERIKVWLRSPKKTPEEEQADRDAALNAMHEALPDELSARRAVMLDRERKRKDLDEALRE